LTVDAPPSPFFSQCLDHVRWISAVFVLLGHTRSFLFKPFKKIENPDSLDYLFYALTNLQNEAVICFFVISGYLIGGKLLGYYQQGHVPVRKYITDRLVRLYIVLLPSLGLVYITSAMGFCDPPGTDEWLASIFYLQHIISDVTACNIPLWSLANEFWYYVIGLLVVVGLLHSRAISAVGLLLVMLVLIQDDFTRENVLLCFPMWILGVFLLNQKCLNKCHIGIIASGAIFILTIALSRSHLIDNLFFVRDTAIAIGLFLVLVSLRNTTWKIAIAPNFGRFMASFSFSLYLIHWPLLKIIRKLMWDNGIYVNLLPDSAYAIFTYLGVCLSCLVSAYVFSLVTERNTGHLRSLLLRLIKVGKPAKL